MDVTDLPAHEAMALIDRLPTYWQVAPNGQHVYSAVHVFWANREEEIKQQTCASPAELADLGVPFREVTPL